MGERTRYLIGWQSCSLLSKHRKKWEILSTTRGYPQIVLPCIVGASTEVLRNLKPSSILVQGMRPYREWPEKESSHPNLNSPPIYATRQDARCQKKKSFFERRKNRFVKNNVLKALSLSLPEFLSSGIQRALK